MKTDVKRCAARGIVGAMAMTGVRSLAAGAGVVDETPPEAVADEKLRSVSPRHQDAVVEAVHWLVGAAGGVGYGMLPQAIRRRVWSGPAYGLAMWFGFEKVIAPALGLSRRHESRPAERAVLAADHALYGLVVRGASS
ncbi:MAG: hypothetical protein ACR2FF_09440 [Mycobacteriales bacterium]|nr:MAG: hypothetical protein DLM56_13385 [Pseudonocardiales bacterium]